MSMTDPIADMLTRLRNGNAAHHDAVTKADVGSALTIVLKYGPNRERTISGVRRISKPGLRVYAKKENLPRVLGGMGIAIISTASGLLTDRAAHKAGSGG